MINRENFNKNARKRLADKGSKGFSSWDLMVAMMYLQLAQAKSLREIEYGLKGCVGKLRHLGMAEAPKRSTLSYANAHRPWQLFRDTFYQMLEHCQGATMPRKRKFKFKNKLFSLDATSIEMALSVFDWAKYRRAKGAVKIHLLLDHDGYLPTYAKLTDGKTHEVNIAHELKLAPGSIVAMDRGYLDFKLLKKWDKNGIYFVTRTKVNTVYTVVKDNPLPERKKHVLEDKIIRLRDGHEYRLVTVYDEVNEMYLELLTNIRKLAAATIGDIYHDRWQIEVFFRYLKQNLKIKTFVGTSPNSVLIQVWTALTAMLMLAYMRFKSTFGWSLSNLVAMFRWNVFAHKELWGWLDNPFESPPPELENRQPNLPGFNFGQQSI
jgi:hypothetical protein